MISAILVQEGLVALHLVLVFAEMGSEWLLKFATMEIKLDVLLIANKTTDTHVLE
jgi:hypothetical protein